MKKAPSNEAKGPEEPMRIDKWLWAARFFRTRAIARDALDGGMVQVAGSRAKASRAVQVGDRIDIRKESIVWKVVVQALSMRRGNSETAQSLYEETPASVLERDRLAAEARERRVQPGGPIVDLGRPSKRDRREITRFKERMRD